MRALSPTLAVALLLLLANLVRMAGPGAPAETTERAGQLPRIGAGERSAGFTFGAGVAPADRQAIETAVSTARPEAQRLIAVVDGMTEVHVGPVPGGAAGSATDHGGRYSLQLDMAMVAPMGPRAVSRLVLHELAHVIDFALVGDDLLAELDAAVPEGWTCEEGRVGSCAEKPERFAETFAKWATGDIGVDIYLGYKVPPPNVPLDTWGAPLSGLGA